MYSTPNSFYASKEWATAKLELIQQRGMVCQKCGKTIINPTYLIPHHKKKITAENVNNPLITLNADLIELVCFWCHNQEHDRFTGFAPKVVYLVYGPPRAGKTTLVKELAHPDDLIVDIDALWDALCIPGREEKPGRMKDSVLALHRALLDMVAMRQGNWRKAWVIGTYPRTSERERVRVSLGAEPVEVAASKEEALARCQSKQQREWVEEYFAALS